jgi:outer membrane receptor protein involved in Fe transport
VVSLARQFISSRVKFLPLAWAGMPKTSFRKNSDSPNPLVKFQFGIDNIFDKTYAEHFSLAIVIVALF